MRFDIYRMTKRMVWCRRLGRLCHAGKGVFAERRPAWHGHWQIAQGRADESSALFVLPGRGYTGNVFYGREYLTERFLYL